MTELLQANAPLPQILQDLAATYADSDTHPDHARVVLKWSTAIGKDGWPRYLELQQRVVGMLTEAIAQG